MEKEMEIVPEVARLVAELRDAIRDEACGPKRKLMRKASTALEAQAAELAIEEAATALRLSAGGGWRTIESAPECDWTKGEKPTEALLYSPQFGVRTGQVGRFRDHLFGNVANLHGNAIADWGATHWMPLPASPTVEVTHD